MFNRWREGPQGSLGTQFSQAWHMWGSLPQTAPGAQARSFKCTECPGQEGWVPCPPRAQGGDR